MVAVRNASKQRPSPGRIDSLSKRIRRFALAFGMAASLLTEFATRAEPTQTPTTPASQPFGTLRVARLFDPMSLDPAKIQLAEDYLLMVLVHLPLIDVDSGTRLIPCAARSWSMSQDQQTCTVFLHPGLRFSNGRPIVADDYIYAIERILTPATGSVWSSYIQGIRGVREFAAGSTNRVAGIRSPAPDQLIFDLVRPDPTFPFVLNTPAAMAVPREDLALGNAHFSSHPTGAGPYQVGRWVRGARITFIPNPHYNGPAPRLLNGVEVMIGGDEMTHLMMFEQGELDIANITSTGLPVADMLRLRTDPIWAPHLEQVRLMNTLYLSMNTEMGSLTNAALRRAINWAIQRDRWLRVPIGLAAHANGVIPPTLPGYNPELKGYDYSPDRARQELRNAGLTPPIRLELWHGTDERNRWIAQGIQNDLAEVGIELSLKPVTYAQLVDAAGMRGKVPMHLTGWNVSIPDPSDFFNSLLDSRAVNDVPTLNTAFYQNAEVDRLIGRAVQESDLKHRFQLYQEAERIVIQDAPWVFLGHAQLNTLRQPWLKGPLIEPLFWYRFDRVWIDRALLARGVPH